MRGACRRSHVVEITCAHGAYGSNCSVSTIGRARFEAYSVRFFTGAASGLTVIVALAGMFVAGTGDYRGIAPASNH